MELKVGMYLRTEDGYLLKYFGIQKELEELRYKFNKCIFGYPECRVDYLVVDEEDEELETFLEDAMFNYNPIDLIQVGDILVDKNNKKYEITGIKIYEDMGICLESRFSINGNSYILKFGSDDIKSIVTKERFKKAEYRLEN